MLSINAQMRATINNSFFERERMSDYKSFTLPEELQKIYDQQMETKEGRLKLLADTIYMVLTKGPNDPQVSALHAFKDAGYLTETEANNLIMIASTKDFMLRFYFTLINESTSDDFRAIMVKWYESFEKKHQEHDEVWANASPGIGMTFVWIRVYHYDHSFTKFPEFFEREHFFYLMKDSLKQTLIEIEKVTQSELSAKARELNLDFNL